jgi:hypothetical protein
VEDVLMRRWTVTLWGTLAALALLPVLAFAQDADSDGIPDQSDLCPFYASANQSDVDQNGIGDECECGDQDGDGKVDASDIQAIQAALFDPAQMTVLCDTNNDDVCNVQDIVGVNTKIYGGAAYCSRYPRLAP